MYPTKPLLYIFFILSTGLSYGNNTEVYGELKKWHKVTLVFEGPETSETDEFNPFYHYRLDVTFSHAPTGKSYVIPGYYAADGDAGETGASSGNIWKAHFSPDELGEWRYNVKFTKGRWAAIRDHKKDASGGFMDGNTGKFTITESDKTGRDFRAHGRLEFIGERYLRFAETEKYFFKAGPDSPENFLAYYAFDGDFTTDGHNDQLVKKWEAHRSDWKEDDPTWKEGKGKEVIGALNYLASKGLNSVSFITNNIMGDDRNVFPYINYNTYDRFDCSKLDQWEIVFQHAQDLGIFLHFKTLEAENQGLLDQGGIGGLTKLYYRELVARFGHHLALNWNLCEEAGDWGKFRYLPTIPWDVAARRSLTEYMHSIDPYHHHMVIHNGNWFTPLYGNGSQLTGASLQTSKEDFSLVNDQVKRVINEAKGAGKNWAVACDEPGDAQHALLPDVENPEHRNARVNGLWGAMLAGAWGTEWYFGYKHQHSDLSCEDYRSRDKFWDMAKVCLDFFNGNNLPVTEMMNMNGLLSSQGNFCFAKPGEVYVILLKNGGESTLNLQKRNGTFSINWYNPRKGGQLQKGTIPSITGGSIKSLGLPPSEPNRDWVVLVEKL
ncbi:MAG: DUF5060 domain-containing protein [Bacteroidota bacterium]